MKTQDDLTKAGERVRRHPALFLFSQSSSLRVRPSCPADSAALLVMEIENSSRPRIQLSEAEDTEAKAANQYPLKFTGPALFTVHAHGPIPTDLFFPSLTMARTMTFFFP